MPRWTHIVFGLIWLVTAIIFGVLAVEAYKSQSTTLLTVGGQMQEGTIYFSGIDAGRTFNLILATNNTNAKKLEDSIRQSGHISFILNLVSCVMAFAGFIAQVGEHLKERRAKSANKNPYNHAITPQSRTENIEEKTKQ